MYHETDVELATVRRLFNEVHYQSLKLASILNDIEVVKNLLLYNQCLSVPVDTCGRNIIIKSPMTIVRYASGSTKFSDACILVTDSCISVMRKRISDIFKEKSEDKAHPRYKNITLFFENISRGHKFNLCCVCIQI